MTLGKIYTDVLAEVGQELERAKTKFPAHLNSHHEGYSILAEEVDELWDDVKSDNHDHSFVEAVQVAAMAVRYVAELRAKRSSGGKAY